MRVVLLCALVVGCVSAQYVKSGVKGGYGGQGYHHRAGENFVSLFGNRTQQGTVQQNVTLYGQSAVGVCFKEVPTASLVKDPRHVPAGNGSRPDLSVIRVCCPGYERNIHNIKLCEPVCSQDCVNSICTAPETCTCYPDHVRNYLGTCVPTCPIGCQNGQCAGGECICNDGYSLDLEGKYCVPSCKDNCGGMGDCTGPNICTCRPGYQSTPQGSCKPACDRCNNGDCEAPNDCRCHQGYNKNARGECISQCEHGCGPNEVCVGTNICAPASNLIPGHGPQQPNYQPGSYPGYPGPRNQTNVPYYPNHGPSQNATPPFNRPEYPGSRPYNPNPQNPTYPGQSQYPSQYPANPGQSQHPNQYPGSPPNYVIQPIGYPYNPAVSDSLLRNSTITNGSYPHQPNQPGYQPGYPGYPGNPGYPGYQPGYQPGMYPPQGFPLNQTYPGYMPNYYFQPGYYQPNLTFPNQYYPGQQPAFRPGVFYQPMYPNPYYNPQNTSAGQPFPYQQNATSNQPWYPQPNHVNPDVHAPNGPSQPGSNFTSQQINPSYHSPSYNEPSNSYPGQGYPQEHTTNRSPNFFNPYGTDYNQHYGQQNFVCTPACVNADCIGDNRCSCHRGFVTDHADPSGSRCKPVCAGGCVNGVCSAPNVCVCNEGYHMDTGVKGRMICVKRIR